MTKYILDTNVVSELVRPSPSKAVASFLATEGDLWISVILLHELAYGCERVSDAVRKTRLLAFINSIKTGFVDRTLAVDLNVAETAGWLRAFAAAKDRTLAPLDSLIAATAVVHGGVLVTRNIRDFAGLGLSIHDPWLA